MIMTKKINKLSLVILLLASGFVLPTSIFSQGFQSVSRSGRSESSTLGAVPGASVDMYSRSDQEDCDRNCRKDLATARTATAKYHDVDRALADGFFNTQQCVQHPFLGAMGIHFVNGPRIGNPQVDPAMPEVLLYMPDEDGDMRLVGVEYVVPGALSATTPELFGQEFHFNPMRNEWALHVWIWRNNPNGMFADFNPKLSCP